MGGLSEEMDRKTNNHEGHEGVLVPCFRDQSGTRNFISRRIFGAGRLVGFSSGASYQRKKPNQQQNRFGEHPQDFPDHEAHTIGCPREEFAGGGILR